MDRGIVVKYRAVYAISMAALLTACGGGGSDSNDRAANNGTQTREVAIEFDAVAGAQAIACDTEFEDLGVADTEVEFRDFRFFIHDVALVTTGGAELPVTLDQTDWQTQNVALLDFENQAGDCADTGTVEMNTMVTGTVVDDGSSIEGIRFSIGVPESLNHANPASAESPLNLTGLHWSWQGGYKFMRIDVAPVGSALASWNIHLGSTACSGDPTTGATVSCGRANRPDIVLTGFDPDTNVVRINYAALILNNDLSQDVSEQPGCMSNPLDAECNDVFNALGLNINTGETEFDQTLFSVAP